MIMTAIFCDFLFIAEILEKLLISFVKFVIIRLLYFLRGK